MCAPPAELSQPLDARRLRATAVLADIRVQQLVVVGHAADKVPERVMQCMLGDARCRYENIQIQNLLRLLGSDVTLA